MATSVASQPVTIREYLKFKAPAGYRDELVYGRIIASPEPKVLHFQIADNLYDLLKKAAGKKYRAAQRINLRFPHAVSMPSPDVFVIAREEYNSALRAMSLRLPTDKTVPLPVLLGGKPATLAKFFDLP